MTECRNCGLAEDLEWGETKDGKPYLVQVRRIPHYVLCPAKKNGAPARRRPRKSGDSLESPATEAAKLLKDMRYTATEAMDMLKDIPEGPPEAMVLAALKRKGEA